MEVAAEAVAAAADSESVVGEPKKRDDSTSPASSPDLGGIEPMRTAGVLLTWEFGRTPEIGRSSHGSASGYRRTCYDIDSQQRPGLGAAAVRWRLDNPGRSADGRLQESPALCGDRQGRQHSEQYLRAGRHHRRARSKRARSRERCPQQDESGCNRQLVGAVGFRRLGHRGTGGLLGTMDCRKTRLRLDLTASSERVRSRFAAAGIGQGSDRNGRDVRKLIRDQIAQTRLVKRDC